MHATLTHAASTTSSTSLQSSRPLAAEVRWPSDGEVHLYWASVEGEFSSMGASALSVDELARASRFRFDRDRLRYVVARSHLRRVLARYYGKAPAQLRFTYSAAGKPELAESERLLRFNLSHCEGRVLIGVSRADIGVDVERIAPLPELDDIATQFFSPADIARVVSADGAERLERFYACWTLNEAFGKATGDGLRHNVAAHLTGDWTVVTPNVAPDVAATVVVRHAAAWIGASFS